MEALGG